MNKISVALAVFNEEKNLGACLESIKDIAAEIVIIDGGSVDKTLEIAKKYGAKIIITSNPPIFHINKQRAIDIAKNDWILQLDADERVTPNLSKEILKIISLSENEIDNYQEEIKKRGLFNKHKKILEERDGKIGKDAGEYAAFFIPRLNYFLGKYLKYGGVYPDGVIRLIKKGKAYLPCKSVHEQFVVLGKVGWLKNDLLHFADPNLSRYLKRNNRYIDLLALEFKENKLDKNVFQFIKYVIFKPIWWFITTQIIHKGILDGWQGIVFSFFSALRFSRAYLRYLKNE